MNKAKRILFNFFLGTVACLLLVSISTPSSSKNTSTLPVGSENAQYSHAQIQRSIDRQLASNLQEAESVLIAQGMSDRSATRYAAALTNNEVVPPSPSTPAFGAAGAVLSGDRLIVRGSFSNLSSALRDYATDPVAPPNPNITSAVHIHRGEPDKNGPFQYALKVNLNESGRAGKFAGDYTLTSEQLQALFNGLLYVDLHTKQNRAGELRSILRPYTIAGRQQ